VSAYIYIEGGGAGQQSKSVDIRCREGFRRLLENCGFQKRMPRLVACGGRDAAFADFKTAHTQKSPQAFVALWVDSEEPLADLESTWKHLLARDGWPQPPEATNDQVLFMTTCMETWLVADQVPLKEHFKTDLQESALPALQDLENRSRREVQDQLTHASRHCSNAYRKGSRSFALLGELNPSSLERLLPSFKRVLRVLKARL
jgi:hypothetical protein